MVTALDYRRCTASVLIVSLDRKKVWIQDERNPAPASMGRCSLRRESDIEYLFDLSIGHCRLRSSCVVIENRKIELTESVKHRSMRGFHFTAPLQPSAVALSGACCPQRRNRRKEQGDSCWVSPDPKLLETPSCYLSGETAVRDFFPIKIASLGIRKGFINRFPVLQATDRIEEDIFISLGSDSLKTWKSAAAFAKNNHTMTLSNNQMLWVAINRTDTNRKNLGTILKDIPHISH